MGTEEEQVAMAIALSMQENKGKTDEKEELEDKKEEGESGEDCKEAAPTHVASMPKSPRVACLLPKNELDNNLVNDEEEIVFSRQHSPPENEKAKGKWTDDTPYSNML